MTAKNKRIMGNEKRKEKEKPLKEFKRIPIEEFEGEHKCPMCGFEWDD